MSLLLIELTKNLLHQTPLYTASKPRFQGMAKRETIQGFGYYGVNHTVYVRSF